MNMRNRRHKWLISLLLSITVLLTFSPAIAAAEDGYEDMLFSDENASAAFEAAPDFLDTDAAKENADDEIWNGELDDGSSEIYIGGEAHAEDMILDSTDNSEENSSKFLEKWSYTVSDPRILSSLEYEKTKNATSSKGEQFKGKMVCDRNPSPAYGQNDESLYYNIIWRKDQTYYYEGRHCHISINGVLGYGNANEYQKSYVNKERTMYIYTPDKTYYRTGDDNKLVINIKNIGEDEVIAEEGANEYILNIIVSQRIDRKLIELNLDEGIYIESEDRYDGTTRFVLTNGTDPKYGMNEATGNISKAVGAYEIIYNSEIPFSGKIKPKEYDDVCGTIIVSYNGVHYEVTKAKIVKLKYAPAGQGPFPTVSNAAIQILKLNGDNREAKKIQKELKKATKVDRKISWKFQALPVIIYPRRITARTQNVRKEDKNTKDKKKIRYIVIKGKKGKYILKSGKGFKIKNGKKDSFKTGVQQLSYNRILGIISGNSADIWTGPYGLPVSAYRVIDKTKGR